HSDVESGRSYRLNELRCSVSSRTSSTSSFGANVFSITLAALTGLDGQLFLSRFYAVKKHAPIRLTHTHDLLL
ncbi:MAG: hypothetical protein WAK86_15550, partial [Pseudonocardiaceae bacterium]